MFNYNLTQTKEQILKIIVSIIILMTTFGQLAGNLGQAWAIGPRLVDVNENELIALVETGQGQIAVEQIAELAYNLGHWEPAPGDVIIFDPYMQRRYRGAVVDYDELPPACADTFDPAECAAEFERMETQVRFGRSFFTTRQQDRSELPRSGDDIMSTFIEETGHSWQEYQYETFGQGGERQRLTTLEEANYWAAGREYQIKRYILSLDGDLLELSDSQRGALMDAICNGYASPTGAEVPAYGPPDGWPNPNGWPTSNPTWEEQTEFCGTVAFEPAF